MSGKQLSWPRVRRNDGPGPKAFILGPIVEDWPIVIDASRAEIALALSAGIEKLRCDWKAEEPIIGGSLAFHARTARRLGYVPHLSCVLPVPCPGLFSRFFEEVGADTRHARVMPGLTPGSILLKCRDGHLLLPRGGVQGLAMPPVPADLFERFDVAIINPGPPPGRIEVLQTLRRLGTATGHRTTLAIAARPDWGREELAALKDLPTGWVFLNDHEASQVGGRLSSRGTVANEEEAIEKMKEQLGSTRLVVTLGGRGAYLSNGRLENFPTTPVRDGLAVGAGDVLLVTTGLSAASGGSDEQSLKRGLRAGTRHVAGYPCPERLEDLDT